MVYEYKDKSISSQWEVLTSDKSTVLTRAEDCSKLTIPTIFPLNDFKDSSVVDDVYQSLGARAVLNLASKLMQTLFPSNANFFKLMPSKDLEEQIMAGSDPQALDLMNQQLVKLETAIGNEMDRQSIRKVLHEAMKLLVVTGNVCLWKHEGETSLFSLRDYSVKRDIMGNIVDLIVREKMSPHLLPDDINLPNPTEEDVIIYTRMVADGEGNYQIYQEVQEVLIAGSEYSIKTTDPLPFIVLRWTANAGSNYGRGLVEHYLGDLRNYEAINMVIVDTASVMARTVFMVNPNTPYGTDVEDLNDAVTGDYIAGHADDITVPQTNKQTDLALLLQYMQILETRLSQAFLLYTQRDAERVTAEEIRVMSQQLEETLGGIYSILSDDLQRPLLESFMQDLNVKLDKSIESVITAGLDALGRGSDANKLLQFLEMLAMIPEGFNQINQSTLVNRLAYSLGVSADGLIKTVEEMQQEAEASRTQMAEDALGESVAKEGGKKVAEQMANQQAI